MARRGDLAGLAALGALGYMLSRGDKAAPTGGGGGRMPAAASEAGPSIDDDMRKRALAEGEKVSEGERVSRYKPNPFDVEDAGGGYDRKPTGRPTATTAASVATGVDPRDREASMSRGRRAPVQSAGSGRGGQGGPTAEELAAYTASRQGGSGRGGQGGPRAGEAEAYARSMAMRGAKENEIPTGGPAGYSGVRGEKIDSSELGRNVSNTLAAMGPGKLSGVSKIGYEMRNADAIRKAAMAGEVPVREAVTNPLAWMAGPKNVGKFSGEVPAAGREAVTNPMAWMSGPKGMAQMNEAGPSMTTKAKEAAEAVAARFRKKALSEADTTGGAIGYKRGGKVKPKKMASGGMARSGASKRADGIATKGKTRGKIC